MSYTKKELKQIVESIAVQNATMVKQLAEDSHRSKQEVAEYIDLAYMDAFYAELNK